jgi:putative heme transporter
MSALRRRRAEGPDEPANSTAAEGAGPGAPDAEAGVASATGLAGAGGRANGTAGNGSQPKGPGLEGPGVDGPASNGSSSATRPGPSSPLPPGNETTADGAPSDESARAKPKRHRWLPRTVRHLAELLLAGFIVEYFVIPQIGGTHKALHVLASVNPFLPVLGVLLEVFSLLAYFEFTRALIPKSSDPGFATLSRIQLSTLALSHCLPGGNAMGYSLGYRLLMRSGVAGTDTAVALATQGLGSAVVLNVIFWLALLVSLPLYGFQSGYLFVAVIGMLLMVAIASLVILLTKGDQRATAFLTAVGRRVPFLHPETLPRLFGQLAARVEELSKDRRQLGKALFFATANWLFDAASLLVFVGAFGHWVDPVALLVAYGVANIAAAIPITPGGLGVVEATVSGILVGFGTPRSIAIWGVLAWRLVNFWLPIPIGGTAYLSLQLHPPAGNQAGLAARRALWRARWRWMAQLFRADTQTPVVEDELAIIGTVVPGDGEAAGPPGALEAPEQPEGQDAPDVPEVPGAVPGGLEAEPAGPEGTRAGPEGAHQAEEARRAR